MSPPARIIQDPAANVLVYEPARKLQERTGRRPAHHLNDSKSYFTNPWESFRFQRFSQFFAAFVERVLSAPVVPAGISTEIPSRVPSWGTEAANAGKVKATWLGHACFLVELPAPVGATRGPRILFDPAMSRFCSPVQFMGPSRYTNIPCPVEDIPAVDAIVISHNHYDHTDTKTLRILKQMHNPQIFMPLGNEDYLRSIGFDEHHVHCLDWWEQRTVELGLPSATSTNVDATTADVKAAFRLTCTPSQHTSARGLFDKWRTLWGAWALEQLDVSQHSADVNDCPVGAKIFFGGDTGYRTVLAGEDEDKVPVCPAFAEAGDKIGGFDLALLPIGAYSPRAMWSCMHANPYDAVAMMKDLKAKRALAMHWGTWVLTTEPVMDPPKLLRAACEKAGLAVGDFDICDLGETRVF